MTTTIDGPPCPRLTPPCAGHLEYRTDPERLVCGSCGRVWSLTEIAVLERARK